MDRLLKDRLEGLSVEFGLLTFNTGSGIRATVDSLSGAADALGLPPPSVILSDSSETEETVAAVRTWAEETGARVQVDRSPRRRATKEASNAIFERATADLLVFLDDDVLILPRGLRALLLALTEDPRPEVAVGIGAPDPRYRDLRYRASAWQMRVVNAIAARLPGDEPRAQGCFWGARRSFYQRYRYPVGSGHVAGDLELTRYAREHAVAMRNAWRAKALKVPAGTLRDFYLQTYRFLVERANHRRSWHFRVAASEAARDPVGAAAYLYARAWSAVVGRRRLGNRGLGEEWEISVTTKR